MSPKQEDKTPVGVMQTTATEVIVVKSGGEPVATNAIDNAKGGNWTEWDTIAYELAMYIKTIKRYDSLAEDDHVLRNAVAESAGLHTRTLCMFFLTGSSGKRKTEVSDVWLPELFDDVMASAQR